MASHKDFVDYVTEQLQQAGNVRAKRMFGEYGLFCEYFHRLVVPTAEKQLRSAQQRDVREIKDKLDRMARNSGVGGMAQVQNPANEQILMPEILAGMKNDEFTFSLYNILLF